MKLDMAKCFSVMVLAILISVLSASESDARVHNPLLIRASFSEDWSRYPSPDTILSTLQQQFPMAVNANQMNETCFAVVDSNSTSLGTSIPLRGSPAVNKPNSGFVVWYLGCVGSFIAADEQGFMQAAGRAGVSDPRLSEIYYGKETAHVCGQPNEYDQSAGRYTNCAWAELSEDKKMTVIREQITRLLGPNDVVAGLGFGSTDKFAMLLMQSYSQALAKDQNAFVFLSSFGTGRVYDAVKGMRFLILLNDTLKY